MRTNLLQAINVARRGLHELVHVRSRFLVRGKRRHNRLQHIRRVDFRA